MLRWQIVCLVGLVLAVPMTWLATPVAWARVVAMIGWSAAIVAFVMAWGAILSERRLTPAQRREILLQLSPKQLRRVERVTRILFVATGTFTLGGLLVLASGDRP